MIEKAVLYPAPQGMLRYHARAVALGFSMMFGAAQSIRSRAIEGCKEILEMAILKNGKRLLKRMLSSKNNCDGGG